MIRITHDDTAEGHGDAIELMSSEGYEFEESHALKLNPMKYSGKAVTIGTKGGA
jgi:hypothetical protein